MVWNGKAQLKSKQNSTFGIKRGWLLRGIKQDKVTEMSTEGKKNDTMEMYCRF